MEQNTSMHMWLDLELGQLKEIPSQNDATCFASMFLQPQFAHVAQ